MRHATGSSSTSRTSSSAGGTTQEVRDEANFVQVLHDDGTTAVYAHLQMDTVRVRPDNA